MPRGRKSYVLNEKTNGGRLLIRLSKKDYPLHKQLASICSKKKISMNSCLIQLIRDYVHTENLVSAMQGIEENEERKSVQSTEPRSEQSERDKETSDE